MGISEHGSKLTLKYGVRGVMRRRAASSRRAGEGEKWRRSESISIRRRNRRHALASRLNGLAAAASCGGASRSVRHRVAAPAGVAAAAA